jgi:malonate-semialdehyde dehydrogenase (acetylating)/methylmalonate-semialdehyde dehydrogenase
VKTINHYIGGGPVAEAPPVWADVHDPALGTVSGRVALGGSDAVAHAVRIAADAQAEWGAASLGVRQQVLLDFVRLVQENRDALATIITSEHGKTLADAHGEITAGVDVAKFASGTKQGLIQL